MKNTVRVIVFIAILASVFYLLRDYIHTGTILGYLSYLITFSVIFIGFVIFLENRHPTQTLTWIVVLGSFPLVGFIFYLLFGRNYRKERMYRKKYILDKQTFHKYEADRLNVEEDVRKMAPHQMKLFKLAQNIGNSPISFASQTKVLTNGEETFSQIIEELKKAESHIHLEYYIVRNDGLGNEIKEILIEKARSGVKVRFLYDAVGSWKLSYHYLEDLRSAGVEAIAFGPVRVPIVNNKFNFRNHRKIIVIDGKVGFVGGLNIGDEYLGRTKYFGFWRDTHLMVEGEAVRTLQLIFLQDWYYMTNESLFKEEYLPESQPMEQREGGLQILAGGPDNEHTVIKDIFFAMISSAKKSVYIASPYFIPDEDIFSALRIAALSGIDVRLLIPKRPDKWLVYFASRSYFPDLLDVGIKIYEYEKGFMHSKIVIVDEELASIGTSNMDMRSFHLNFEVNAFLYRTESTRSLVQDYLNDLQDSRELQKHIFSKRNIGIRLLESTTRLLSPLL